MSFIKQGASALGKLFIVITLAATFLVGLAGVVYMSLQGQELKVPEIVGKDLNDSEKELADLGLRIKKRADRFSNEKSNTILEQLPKAGDVVKTGQMILVVTSKINPDGEEAPATIKKSTDEDDSEKIEELISDKPKKNSNKSNTNTNTKKKSSTTRDVLSNKSDNSNGDSADNSNSNKKDSESNNNSAEKGNKNSSDKGNKNSSTSPANSNKSNPKIPAEPPKPAKTPVNGDVRPRKTSQP